MAFKVEITATHIVKPSRPTPDHLKTHNLSIFDQLAPSIYPLTIFFNNAMPDSYLTPRLKTSLSRVLSSFYPYVGLVNGDVFVDCNDAGIPYSEVVVDCSLSDVLKECDLSLMSQFVPLTKESVILDHTIPLLVQVSFFKCGGITIGVCSSHKNGDAANFFTFFREWANVSLTDNLVLVPEFGISSRFPRLGFLNFNTGIKIQLNEKLVRKRFVLSESSISSLKAQATPCTRVQAVTSLVWKCTMNAVKKSGKTELWAIKENNILDKLTLDKLTTHYHVLRSLVPRFDLQAIDFVILDANSQINFQLHPQNHRIHGSRGCLGCCTKTPFVTTDNKPTGNLGRGQVTNRHSIFEDFCSTSTYEMDNSVPQSQISASSTSNAAVDAQSRSGSNPSEFVNHGLLLWNQTRQQWIGNKAPDHNKKARPPVISWNATYDNLLGTNKPFSRPIPLPEMVNFLVDIWEQEGLYD